jgi:excisionase family DNA binding protein
LSEVHKGGHTFQPVILDEAEFNSRRQKCLWNRFVQLSERIHKTATAAEYIGVSKKTLLKYANERQINFMRYPSGEFRFRKSALDEFMARCTIQAQRKKAA